jgi:hypothetical protein
MKKILHPFDQKLDWQQKFFPVFIVVKENYGYLSLTGVQAPLKSGNAKGGCGQIDMEYDHKDKNQNDKRYDTPVMPDELRFAKGWDAETWYTLLDIWSKWHLKDMTDVPQDVIDWLSTLPDTDRIPNWC